MFGLGAPEILGILVIVLLLFGAKKIPEIMRGMGQGMKEFKKASHEAVAEFQTITEEKPETTVASAPSGAQNDPGKQQ